MGTLKTGGLLLIVIAELKLTNKQVYRVFKAYGLLQKKRARGAALSQVARLFELLPPAPTSCGKPL